jgi:hypothetical protein
MLCYKKLCYKFFLNIKIEIENVFFINNFFFNVQKDVFYIKIIFSTQ